MNEVTKNITPQVDVFEILRFAHLNDNLIGYFTFDTPHLSLCQGSGASLLIGETYYWISL